MTRPTLIRGLRIAWNVGQVFISIFISSIVGSLLLQTYIAIWHPSTYGLFAELPVLLVFSGCICAAVFLVVVVPAFALLRYTNRTVHGTAALVSGLSLGFFMMLWLLLLTGEPFRFPELAAGSAAGAAGVVTYAHLQTMTPWRFSLRTLLIVTTAIAGILGLVVYATR